MKTHLRLAVFLLLLSILLSRSAFAQTAGAAFSCDGTFYQIRQVAVGTANHSQLFRVNRNVTPAADPTTTVYTTTLVLDLATGLGLPATTNFVVNSLAFNSQDGYMYALTYPVSNTGFPVVNLYKIGTGVEDLGTITVNGAVPAATTANPGGYPQLAAGVIDKEGFYYAAPRNLADASNKDKLFRFDLKQASNAGKRNAVTIPMDFYTTASPTVTVTPASVQDFSFIDIGFNPADNTLYGVYSIGSIYKFDFATTAGRARVTRTGTAPATAPNFGSVSFDLAGNLFAYSNEGNFYSVNTTTGTATDIGNVPMAAVTDGASCINPDQRLDVVKEVVSVASVNATTYDVSFAIRVKNTGTVTTTNVQVSDFLRGTTNNTTFPTSTSVAVSGLTVTNSGGALAPNTAYTGQGGDADLLTGNQSLTAGQSALITFTARVVFGTVPNTVQNNTAYASSTAGTNANPGYALQTTDGSLILPPGDVIALDQSTNSAALPLTPNGDSPSPSPVYFTPAILGNVFEDANYGGGAGRSQAVSNGEGVTGAQVELYNATTGAFVAAVTTDAAGNYVFTGAGVTASTAYRVRVVNSTVVSNRLGSVAGLLPVQTFLNGDVNRVGGENPNEPDAAARSGTQTLLEIEAALGTTIQSLTPSITTPASGPLLGVDFGFNFSTIVNTNDAGQGSLRQFILNSNELTNVGLDQAVFNGTVATGSTGTNPVAGVETSIFMINDGRATGAPAGLRNAMIAPAGYNVVTGFTTTLASALPVIIDNGTALDGSKQTNLTGNTNAAVAETTTGPEVTVNFNSLKGLEVTGNSAQIASIGFSNARGTGTSTQGAAVYLNSSPDSKVTDITATNNFFGGIRVDGSNRISITNSIVLGSATQDPSADGIQVLGATVNAVISGNTLSNNRGNGIEFVSGGNNINTISGNIIRSNGAAGINITVGDSNTFSQNTITGNAGDGIVALSGTSGNLFTKNSTSGNGNLGIDLSATTAATGDNVTDNANGKTAASGANSLLNFPVLTQAVITNASTGNLQITGFAPAGSVVEFFLSDKTTDGFGQGKTYLFSTMEGASMTAAANGTNAAIADADARFGNYSGTINGVSQGSETGATRFFYSIPLSSLTLAQVTALTSNTARLTATATTAGNTTSEFSSNILIKQNSPLPVELKAFEVATAKTNALLTWSTASEKGNDHFDVERSLDGRSFERIGQVRGQGTTAQVTNYSFTDANVGSKHPGVVYYRLQQVDTDGTASFSPVRTVRFSAQAAGEVQIRVFPNPATAQDRTVTLDLSVLPQGSYQATLLDATGRIMGAYQVQGGANKTLDVQALPAGAYIVLVRGNGFSLNQRLMKK